MSLIIAKAKEVELAFNLHETNKVLLCCLDVVLEHNAQPYVRTTQRQKWVDERYKKYKEWKEFLYGEFCRQIRKTPEMVFKKDCKYFLDVKLIHKNYTFADSDNILKGINDSLFENDKYNAGKVDYLVQKGKKARLIVDFYYLGGAK